MEVQVGFTGNYAETMDNGELEEPHDSIEGGSPKIVGDVSRDPSSLW